MLPKEIHEDDTLQFSSLLEKHDEINEVGLLKNVEQKTRYLLPNIVEGSSPKAGSKKRKRLKSKLHNASVKEGIDHFTPRAYKQLARRADVGCQTRTIDNTKDAFTMTMIESQSDELSRLIKIEAQKTIKMLEIFMNSNSSTEQSPIIKDTKDTEEIEEKEKEDFLNSVLEITNETNDNISTHKVNYEDRDDLFSGVDRTFPPLSLQNNKGPDGNSDGRTPFSKYIEDCINMNKSDKIDLNTMNLYDNDQFDKNRPDFKGQFLESIASKSISVIDSNKK